MLALACAPAASAKPSRGPCTPGVGTKCLVWNAKVTAVDDGDTIDVDIAGDGSPRRFHVRMTGIDAAELTVYSRDPHKRRGVCHGLEATAALERMIKRSRNRVRLTAQRASSRSGPRRLRRRVLVRSGGRWVDANLALLRAGHALYLPNRTEGAGAAEYSLASQEAAARGIGLFDTSYCGAGPEPNAQLRVHVKWDADGTDGHNVNGEWIEVRNMDQANPVAVGGWSLGDSVHIDRVKLPPGTVIPAGGRIRLHAGHGQNDGNDFFWGFDTAHFEPDGEGGYLFDPQGDLRAWMQYPCRVGCTDPAIGSLRVSASPQRPEYVLVRNAGSTTFDLADYILWLPFHQYEFETGSTLAPGETLRLDILGDPGNDTRLHRYYGYGGYMLADRGDRVLLRNYRDVTVACDAWGNFSC
ncbi:MAG: competence protein ComEC [Thermoleophilaceae bacterium]|nr:competence protein ComEC [Thermoleophilaceae bacterium]